MGILRVTTSFGLPLGMVQVLTCGHWGAHWGAPLGCAVFRPALGRRACGVLGAGALAKVVPDLVFTAGLVAHNWFCSGMAGVACRAAYTSCAGFKWVLVR